MLHLQIRKMASKHFKFVFHLGYEKIMKTLSNFAKKMFFRFQQPFCELLIRILKKRLTKNIENLYLEKLLSFFFLHPSSLDVLSFSQKIVTSLYPSVQGKYRDDLCYNSLRFPLLYFDPCTLSPFLVRNKQKIVHKKY